MIGNPDVAVLLPTAAQRITIRQHAEALHDFLSVTMSLQREDATIKESEILFRSLIESFSFFEFSSYLSPLASIVHSPFLETGIFKIQCGGKMGCSRTKDVRQGTK